MEEEGKGEIGEGREGEIMGKERRERQADIRKGKGREKESEFVYKTTYTITKTNTRLLACIHVNEHIYIIHVCIYIHVCV